MQRPVWKQLVDSLSDSGFESIYLERLKSRVDTTLDRPGLEREILQEMANALGKSGEKVDIAFLKLQVLGKQIDETQDEVEKRELVLMFNEQRNRAMHALRELIIHREAIGLRDNRRVRQLYPIPAPKVSS